MKTLELGNRAIQTALPAFIMGIVNATPDSFYEGSRGGAERALRLVEEGADIIDIGGESTRPGAEYVSAEEELSRVIPVLREVRKRSDIPVSIDTRKKSVMEAAFNEGADILNDVSALSDDAELCDFVAAKKIPVVLMHKRGIPAIMQKDTRYGDVFGEVDAYLAERADFALSCGVQTLIVDPGIGFGKDTPANVALIKNCGKLCGGKFPVLVGLSRKSFVGELTGRSAQERLYGTLAAGIVAVQNGADILRVHDASQCADTLKVLQAFC